MRKHFQGAGVALLTPFKEDLSIDFPALGRLVDNLIDNGIDFLVVLGTTAETATMIGRLNSSQSQPETAHKEMPGL